MNYEYDMSVIIPAFNQEEFIAQTIESALLQNFSGKYEILVSDDRSEDETWELIKRYEHLDNVRINRFVKQVMLVAIINKQRKGKYIAHLDGDDLFYPNKLQKALMFLKRIKAVHVYFTKWTSKYSSGEIFRNYMDIDVAHLILAMTFS